MKLVLVLLALIFALCDAGIPMYRLRDSSKVKIQREVGAERCEAPTLWEAKQMSFDESKKAGALAKISYDARDRRIRVVEEVFHNETRDYFDMLALFGFEETVFYVLNMRTKKCEKKVSQERFRPVEPPANASYRGEYYIGAPAIADNSVLVDVYAGDVDGGRFWGTFTRLGCVPVAYGYERKDIGYMHSNFFDVVLGIEDPNVFEIPKECL